MNLWPRGGKHRRTSDDQPEPTDTRRIDEEPTGYTTADDLSYAPIQIDKTTWDVAWFGHADCPAEEAAIAKAREAVAR